MKTAASFPVLILGLPAGAGGDIIERRLLMFWQALDASGGADPQRPQRGYQLQTSSF
jgi:hypothetical protein